MTVKALLELLSSPLLALGIGLIGIILAVYFYRKSKPKSRISLQSSEVTVIGGRRPEFQEDLEIHFNGEVVERVTMTRTVLWNSGNTTIDGSSIVNSDPLRIEINDNAQLLKIDIVRKTREVISPYFEIIHGNAAVIRFEFLDPGDGITVETIHSGGKMDAKWEGTIKGIPSGFDNTAPNSAIRKWVKNHPKSAKKIASAVSSIAPIFGVILGVIMSTMGFLQVYLEPLDEALLKLHTPSSGPNWSMVVAGAVYASLPLMLIWLKRRRFPASLDVSYESKIDADKFTED